MTGMTLKTLCAFAAAAILSGNAFAQENTQTTGEETSQAVELPLGEPAEPKLGEPYEREQIVDWAIRCIRKETPDNEDCQMYQLLKNTDGSGIAEVSLVSLRGDENVVAVANIMTPLGTMLRPGLVMAVDENEPKVYPFTVCSQQGCLSRFGITNEVLDQLKSGNTAIVEIVAAISPDRPIVLDVSLSGFTRGFETLLEQAAKTPQ